jgi:ribonuclease BN (tRNA processing enzyme)
MKLIWKGRSVGFSGDTKYDEAVISRLNRPELTAEWFADCDLVFHEVELVRPPSVHSYYTEVLKLARQLPGRLVVYHTFGNTAPLEMAQEGHWYDL